MNHLLVERIWAEMFMHEIGARGKGLDCRRVKALSRICFHVLIEKGRSVNVNKHHVESSAMSPLFHSSANQFCHPIRL
jgi:hypothetical protein